MITPGSANPLLAAGGEYEISRSLRFNSVDSTYLNWTPSSVSNRKTWTFSTWLKRSRTGAADEMIFSGGGADSGIRFKSNDTLEVLLSATSYRVSSAVFRDVGAWYHIVWVLDTTNATAQNRTRVWVNNQEITAWSTNTTITQNVDFGINNTAVHRIGAWSGTLTDFFNGYQTDVILVDGLALTPASFGETDVTTGIWKPKSYVGTYGTNGRFYNFSDNSGVTSTTLGKDLSGNANHATPNNFSVTAGAGNDSLVDVPTLWGSDTGAGGEVRGNYATLNPLAIVTTSRTYSNGNLDVSIATTNANVFSSFAIPTSGKWYWEYQITTIGGGGNPMGGVAAGFITDLSSAAVYRVNGDKIVNATQSAYGATYTTTDIIGVAVDVDGGTVTFYKNGSSQGALTFAAGGLFPVLRSNAGTDNFTMNFGQRPFAYTAPSGFKALCTTNLPEPTIKQGNAYFDIDLYTGNSTARSRTGFKFQPDLVWGKTRNSANSNVLVDALRGVGKQLFSDLTNAEVTRADSLTAFNSDGYSLGVDSSRGFNYTGETQVSWLWKANGAGVSNTAGTITSTVSANTTSGFSIVTYTGNGTAGATVGHGLGVAPKMVITKYRGGVSSWAVYHASLGATNWLLLNSTQATTVSSQEWNNTAPTSTVFTIGSSSSNSNQSGTYVAYCFAEVAGFSRFGSYTGNGSTDGPFVFCGFRPRYLLFKRTDTSGNNWGIYDTARNTYNVADLRLFPDTGAAESTDSGIDFVSNGFKIRSSIAGYNASGGTYIYAAFAENPFKYSLAR